MNSLSTYIIEKLKIDKNTSIIPVIDNSKLSKNKEMQLSEDEIYKILDYSEKLPIKPIKIEVTRTGGVKLIYKSVDKGEWGTWKNEIHITKPERYNSECYKINWYNSKAYRPFEFPCGKEYKDKNGNPKLSTIDEVFEVINNYWNKNNYSEVIK